jgi:hypothetical protein
MSDEEIKALRKAASCISELLVSTLCTPTMLPGYRPRAMFVWEEKAIEFLREQWERDPETPINDWTAQIVRGELTPSYQGWIRTPLPTQPISGI